MIQEILKMEGITKIYSNGVVANNKVFFSVNKGEIHSLLGENGAGKSTLMKILFGIEQPEEGRIFLNGKSIVIHSSSDAIKKGIGMVHQHFMLVPSLTVAENIILGAEPKRRGFLDFKKAIDITKQLSDKYNLPIDPKAIIEDISVGVRQKVEILKALYRGAQILILDEPTAVLTPQETEELFKQLVILKESGHTIIFISHKLNEIKAISDRLTIMRKGKDVGIFNESEISKEEISNIMVGKNISLQINKQKSTPKTSILRIENLTYTDANDQTTLKNISLSLRKGEILGVAGVEGNGQRELVETITGIRKGYKGQIIIDQQDINGLTIKQIRNLGVAHIPGDRMVLGVAGEASIEENIISDRFEKKYFNKSLFLDKGKIHTYASQSVNDYKIICKSEKQPIKMLSGGNIQKVIVAREFSSRSKLLIADQPTRGIDVGAANFIHKKMIELRDHGVGVLLVSADLTEIMKISDGLIVMYGGEIVAYFEDVSKVTEYEAGKYMLGLQHQDKQSIRRCMYA